MSARRMRMPDLPDNQRWSVHSEFGTFVIVRLQERRWWGWRTIASSTGSLYGGAAEVASCVDHILRRDYFDRLARERRREDRRRRSEIPFGVTKSA